MWPQSGMMEREPSRSCATVSLLPEYVGTPGLVSRGNPARVPACTAPPTTRVEYFRLDARRATPHAQGPLVGAERCPPVGYRALAKTRDVDGRENRADRAPEAAAVYEDQGPEASRPGERQAERDRSEERRV